MSKRVLSFCFPIIVFPLVFICARATAVAQRPKVTTTAFCKLVKNIETVPINTLFRVKATLVGGMIHGGWLQDDGCSETVEPVIVCASNGTCRDQYKKLSERAVFDGDFARVDIEVVGQVASPARPHDPDSPYRFLIQHILDVSKPSKKRR